MITRKVLEEREIQTLAPYAMCSQQGNGRVYPEEEHNYRTAYQRDRDRIIHTTAFRRLEYKTQVFVYSEGDHYRNRLTHSIEVAQIGRTLARTLGCNEDLTEAICLAHDLGHPPFGHTGEATLDELMTDYGGYDHQKQTYRILTKLEDRYPEHSGLNLTYEVLEGVVKHDPDFDVTEAADYRPSERGTLECQLSNLADEIAYNTSDLDDGLRSGLLDPAEVSQLEIAQHICQSLREDSSADSTIDLGTPLQRHRFIRRLVATKVTDVIQTTHQAIKDAGITSLADLRNHPVNVADYSPKLKACNTELRRYLYNRFYRHHRVMRMSVKAGRLITDLYQAYVNEPLQLPTEIQQQYALSVNAQTTPLTTPIIDQASINQSKLARVICDYIAGMTDRYAIQEHQRLFDYEERS
ncbi:MAG: deoxyguanosinetriphosphate triphosphohydrolase [Chloroflexota bacterium]